MSSSVHPAEVNIPGVLPEDPPPAVHPESSSSSTDPPNVFNSPAARAWWPFSLLWRTSPVTDSSKVTPSAPSTTEVPPVLSAAPEHATIDDIPIPVSPPDPALPRPCTCRVDGRNLVVCIDGTSNQFSIKNTNVVELYSRLVKDRGKQRTFYNSGIGTYAQQSWKSWDYYKQVMGHNLDLAIAWRFERILLSAYLWLSQNYRDGDRIFLFGFSRGAYQVRALSAMIESVGLLHKGNEDQIPFAYQLYAEMNPAEATVSMKARFKKTFSQDVRIHFVGVWDTVSSVGVLRGKTLPGTTDGMKHVCYFRHALALHEHRVKFLPEYVRGGLGPDIGLADEPKSLHTKEVWFSGSHSDIGGGAVDNDTLNRFGPSLRWMSFEATQFGLLLDPAPRKWEVAKISQSLTWGWTVLEYTPIPRLSYTGPEDTVSWPHFGKARVIQPGQRIHESVLEAIKLDEKLSGGQDMSPYAVELDPYGAVRRIYHEIKAADTPLTRQDMAALSLLTESESGRQSLRDLALELSATDSMSIAMRVLSSFSTAFPPRNDVPGAMEAACTVVTVLETFSHQYSPAKLRPVARTIARVDVRRADKIMKTLSTQAICELRGHVGAVRCVAFLSHGRRLVTSSSDKTVRIWDIKTGATVIGPLKGHTYIVRCVTVHGSRIASCAYDGTFRVWNADSGELTVGPITADDGKDLNSIAYSRDGTLLATGGNANRAALWDPNLGVELRQMVGHTAPVMCVTFSEDGTRLASGSQDNTVRIWDVASGECIGEPLVGHTRWVRTVRFSPDGKRIFSSSEDKTIRIWDTETRTLVFDPIQIDDQVLSMALSPDGKRLASGGSRGKIIVWDAETGAAIWAPYRDHKGPVWGLAFSADGREIASAGEDGATILWNTTGDWKRYDVDDDDSEKGGD